MNMEPSQPSHHYYGDRVRALFVAGGFIMVVSYPFFSSFVSAPLPISIIGVVALAVFAGLMNPKQRWIMALNLLVSIAGFAVFEYSAIYAYLYLSSTEYVHLAFFWVNQVLSLIFFFASYLSTKTLRGAMLAGKKEENY